MQHLPVTFQVPIYFCSYHISMTNTKKRKLHTWQCMSHHRINIGIPLFLKNIIHWRKLKRVWNFFGEILRGLKLIWWDFRGYENNLNQKLQIEGIGIGEKFLKGRVRIFKNFDRFQKISDEKRGVKENFVIRKKIPGRKKDRSLLRISLDEFIRSHLWKILFIWYVGRCISDFNITACNSYINTW